MAAFDPFARQIFRANDYVGVDGGDAIDVINPLVDSNALHFGGRKYSGVGSLFGRAGLNSFRQIKMVTLDPKPVLQDWWYPYPDDWFHTSSR